MTGLKVVLTGTSNQFLWPRLPVAGELTINEIGTTGRIINATFRLEEADGRLTAPVEVRDPVFTYNAASPEPSTSAALYHTGAHHQAQATGLYLDRLRGADPDDTDVHGITGRERMELHLRFAELRTAQATARAVGALLAVTPARQDRAVETEARAWQVELGNAVGDEQPHPARPRHGIRVTVVVRYRRAGVAVGPFRVAATRAMCHHEVAHHWMVGRRQHVRVAVEEHLKLLAARGDQLLRRSLQRRCACFVGIVDGLLRGGQGEGFSVHTRTLWPVNPPSTVGPGQLAAAPGRPPADPT